MSQTAYSVNQSAAQAGQLGDNGPRDVMSYMASEVMLAGLALAKGTGDNDAKLPASSGDVTASIGVSILSQAKEQVAGVVQSAIGDAVPVLREGRIWVISEQAVTPADAVFVRFAAGAGGSQKGSFRKDADTASASALVKAKFLSSASAGGLVLLEIDV